MQKPQRCPWADPDKLDYIAYHDHEWGIPVHDDRVLFEFLILESAQAGLSWYTVLRKRQNYRIAFDDFDPVKVAEYDDTKINSLLSDTGIIRNRGKILAAVNNAQHFLEIQATFGNFDTYLWQFMSYGPIVNSLVNMSDYPANSRESDLLSKDLKKRGFKFIGSTICYAYMQAIGMVNDHILDCFRRQPIIDGYPLTASSSTDQW